MKIQEKSKHKCLSLTIRSKKAKKPWNGIPAFIKKSEPETSLYKSFLPSITGHVIFILLLALLFSILNITGLNPLNHNKKIKDIAFTLNNHSRYTESRATSRVKKSVLNQTSQQPISDSRSVKNIPKESSIPGEFSIPIPKIKPLSSGLGGLSRKTTGTSSGSSINSPQDIGSDSGSSSIGSASGTGFDKNALGKTLNTYDINPYVNELKRNVRCNWKPLKGYDNKSVELFLRIAKDGKLIILNVKRTSEIGAVDEAALNAVRKTLPLNPLPLKYSKSYLDLVFTFNPSTSSVSSRY
ncbi:MAG: TonB C-terminal domain-containing protein [Candidatus Gastranaerophilales bacterium]|nr:TonB C-terminal domain-containing protein [Candidatus Gastranaerophilales bacterium]